MSKLGYRMITLVLLILFLAGALAFGIFSTNKYLQDTRYQFFCEKLRAGISKDEAKEHLAKYGIYSWQDDYVLAGLSYIYFERFDLRIALGNPVVLRFDNEDKLMQAGSRKNVGDEIQIDCAK